MKNPGFSLVIFVSVMSLLKLTIPLCQRNITKLSRSEGCCTHLFCQLILWDRNGFHYAGRKETPEVPDVPLMFQSERCGFGETKAQEQAREASMGRGSLVPQDELALAATSCGNTQRKKIHSKL